MSIKNTDRDLSKLDGNFLKKVQAFLLEVGDAIFVTEGYRSAERQRYLYQVGATYLDGSPGRESMHQSGKAIDIAFNGPELYPSKHSTWADIAVIAKKHGMDWGYDLWSHTGFIDKPHFQDDRTAYTGFTKSPVSMYSDLKRYPVFGNYDNDGQTKQLIEVALYRYHQTVKDSL